jgi:nitrite reductase/ring-hydroxylating ferredoxin subunit
MFVPTIKYKRVNESSIKEEKLEEIVKKDEEPKEIVREVQPKEETNKVTEEYVFEEEEEGTEAITVDPNDKDRIIITLSTGKQYSADRYCPHAGADLTYHGKLGESDYPPEIGPIVLCQFHYWEFALERNGDGFGGRATINACPVGEKCSSKKLDW